MVGQQEGTQLRGLQTGFQRREAVFVEEEVQILIYFPDPEKDSDISVYEKHFKPGGKYSWSPSRRLLSTDYTKFGRTYFILKGVSREQFLRCVDPYNRRIR